MNHSASSTTCPPPEWSNAINTPSPIFFPSASPTPKLSSTPTKKPPSPVDWHEEMTRDERQTEAGLNAATINSTVLGAKKKYSEINKASFTFDGDLTRPELDSLLEKLQQSTLSADTMTSSFLGDLDDDILPEDLFAVLSAATDTLTNFQNEVPPTSTATMTPQVQKQLQQESDSQQLRQWLEQLPEVLQQDDTDDTPIPLDIEQGPTTAQEMKRASFIKVGRQWVSRMKKVAAGTTGTSNIATYKK